MSTLKVLREVNNYTQEYVAEHIGVDQSTYSKLERNPKNLLAEQAQRLADLYQVSLSEIISGGLSISFTGDIAKNGYVQNHYEDVQKDTLDKIVNAKDSEIKSLKEEIGHLRKEIEYHQTQNKQLLNLLGKDK